MIRIGPDRTIGGTGIWIIVGGKLYLREKTTPYGTGILEFVLWRRFLLAPLLYPAKVLCLH